MSSGGHIGSIDGAPPNEIDLLRKVVTRMELWERGIGKEFRAKCERLHDQYRGFKRWESAWIRAGSRDRDGYVREAVKEWGAELHIPLSYRTIETIVPRAVANAPKLLYLPRHEKWEPNVEAVQALIDAQQEAIDIDLPFQDVMRDGQIYGLGVGKTSWDRQVRKARKVKPRLVPLPEKDGGEHYLSEAEEEVTFDGPRFESVDLWAWAWDPYGYDMRTVDWTAQTVWLTLEGVLARLPSAGGAWNTESAKLLDEDAITKLGNSNQRYDEVWRKRMHKSGFSTTNFPEQGEGIHELIEYHNGNDVFTVLDRQVLVQTGENPCGEMPFQVYRPTPLSHQMVGIGALEPLEHLQRELNTLRSQRRDLVTLALCAGYAYDASAIDPNDLEFGPAAAIEVDGNPREALLPLGIKDVPGAGYQEEQAILQNMNDVAGLTDALDNSSPSASTTATEAQMVQAALGKRIELGSRRFELEVVRSTACQFLYLDQRKITEERTYAQPEQEPDQTDPDAARYRWVQVGPGELQGEFEIRVEGGSLAARNTAQDRSDAAQLFNTLAGDWFTNPTMVREQFYRLMGFKNPKAWLRSPEPSVPQSALRMLVQMGYDPQAIAMAVLRAREVSAPQEGEGAEQLTALSGSAQGAQQ